MIYGVSHSLFGPKLFFFYLTDPTDLICAFIYSIVGSSLVLVHVVLRLSHDARQQCQVLRGQGS